MAIRPLEIYKARTANIIIQQFTCNAIDEDDAENKYNAYFEGIPCDCDSQGIPCICSLGSEVWHEWEEE